MFLETNTRSIVKTLSWRVFATLATAVIVFALTGKWVLAAAVSVVELFSKMALYYVHERAWNRSNFGRKEVRPAVIWITGPSDERRGALAAKVAASLKERGLKTDALSGDDSEGDIKRLAYLAGLLEKHGVFVVAAVALPDDESRNCAKGFCQHFIEVETPGAPAGDDQIIADIHAKL